MIGFILGNITGFAGGVLLMLILICWSVRDTFR